VDRVAHLATPAWTGKKSADNPLEKIRVIAQDVKLYDIKPQNLTSDCHVVIRKDGIVDVIRAHKMVDIFDHYHDLGIRIQKIELSGGTRNPRLQSSEV